MSEVKLLPLPEVPADDDVLYAWAEDYARANMEPLLAENERLRGEVAEAKDGWRMANSTAELAMKHRDEAEARAERLAEECDRLQRQLRQAHKDYGYELRDPNGTIWEHAAKQQARAERLAEALRKVDEQLCDVECESAADARAVERCHDIIRAALDQEGGNG